jgi:hypothetical protein
LFGFVVFGLEGIHQAQPHQIGELDLHRHGAAIGRTSVTKARPVTSPSFATVNIYNGYGRSHGWIISAAVVQAACASPQ